MRIMCPLAAIVLSCWTFLPAQTASPVAGTDDSKAIEQIENELRDEKATVDVYNRLLSDDYVNLIPRGVGPGKAEIVARIRRHAGETLPYTTEIVNMHIYVLGDTAVAAFTKIYTAKVNGNVDREDTTHIFQKDHGAWRLKISRATRRGSDPD